jgi:aryl-alcohol dehydrogenase-like predicted oxidoreductase
MKYRRLGRSGLKVSEFCLGSVTFGGQVDEAGARAIVDECWNAGVNFFDVADVYNGGVSEEILGRLLKDRRAQAVIATKVYGVMGPGPNDRGASRAHIMHAIDGSLRRLQTDYVDLYYVHHYDSDTPLDETLHTLDDLVRAGKVRYAGCSNFAAWQLCKSLWTSDVRGLARFDCIQPRYNLIYRDMEDELLPLCAEEGIGVVPYNPLAGGFLTGKYQRGQPPPANTRFALPLRSEMYMARYWHDRNFEAMERYKTIAGEHGKTPAQLALAWVMHNPTVTAPIVGATSVAQIRETLKVVDMLLSPAEMEACDEVWRAMTQPAD